MEVARSLEPRRLEVRFEPERTADAVLSKAFDRLTRVDDVIDTTKTTEQTESDCRRIVVPLFEEVVR